MHRDEENFCLFHYVLTLSDGQKSKPWYIYAVTEVHIKRRETKIIF